MFVALYMLVVVIGFIINQDTEYYILIPKSIILIIFSVALLRKRAML